MVEKSTSFFNLLILLEPLDESLALVPLLHAGIRGGGVDDAGLPFVFVFFPQELQPSVTTVCVWLSLVSLRVRR